MSDEISVDDVIDRILQTWAAWGSSVHFPDDQKDMLLNADLMHVDLALTLALRLLEVGQRVGDPDLNRAIGAAVSGLSDVYDKRDLVLPGSRTLDREKIERIHRGLGFEGEAG